MLISSYQVHINMRFKYLFLLDTLEMAINEMQNVKCYLNVFMGAL